MTPQPSQPPPKPGGGSPVFGYKAPVALVSVARSARNLGEQLRQREMALNSNQPDDAGYPPLRCSEQLLLTRPDQSSESVTEEFEGVL